jgi:hypothetical protein
MLENPLADVAGQEQSIRFGRRQRCESSQLRRREILRLVNDHMIERFDERPSIIFAKPVKTSAHVA